MKLLRISNIELTESYRMMPISCHVLSCVLRLAGISMTHLDTCVGSPVYTAELPGLTSPILAMC